MNLKHGVAIVGASLALVLLQLAIAPRSAQAGQIRKLYLTEQKPGAITLAFGQSTVLSFFSKPERVVPGSPHKLQIDFLGRDITVTPLASSPGNLIVYTKSGRFVLLLKIGTASSYDDVVQIEPGRPRMNARPLRLLKDTFHLNDKPVIPRRKSL